MLLNGPQLSRALRAGLLPGIVALLGGLLTPDAVAQTTGSFVLTGATMAARSGHTATLLNDGRVLITGGIDQTSVHVAMAEIYDPLTRVFSPTGSLITPRAEHTATLLPDGRVLIAGGGFGGLNQLPHALASAELYDPATGTFSATGNMVNPLWQHSATLLANGKVFISGGQNIDNRPQIYDPLSGAFAVVSGGGIAPGSVATRLMDGTVLAAGGCPANATIYDPAAGTAHLISTIPVPSSAPYNSGATCGVDYHSATSLADGKVLIAGGAIDGYGEVAINQAYLYNPATQSIQATGPLGTARDFHTATLLPNHQVLVTGGYQGVGPDFETGARQSSELYDPIKGTFGFAASMNRARAGHTATLLRDGRVLVVGGADDNTAELYGVSTTPSGPQCDAQACRRVAVVPWYAAIPGAWETDVTFNAGPAVVHFEYLSSWAFTYDGFGHNLALSTGETSEGGGIDLASGSSSSIQIIGGVLCRLSNCQSDPNATGSLIVGVDSGGDPSGSAAVAGANVQVIYKSIGYGSAATQPAIFIDEASQRWSAALAETPRSQQSRSGAMVTSFAVVNLSPAPQAVLVKVFDQSGNLVAAVKTRTLGGASPWVLTGVTEPGVGEVYADTLANLLGADLPTGLGGPDFHGVLVLEGEGGGKIAPSIFQFDGRSIATAVAKPE